MRNDIERLACYDKAVAHIAVRLVCLPPSPGEDVRRQYRPLLWSGPETERETNGEELQQIKRNRG